MIIKLRKPINDGDETITELNLNLDALTGKDLLAAARMVREPMISANTDARYHAAVAARAARVPFEIIERLGARDFTEVTAEVQLFLLDADSGGEAPSRPKAPESNPTES